jgi:dihydropteroate synthase
MADITDNRPTRVWRHRHGELTLGGRTLLMGVVNVTPDSFSDGGRFMDPEAAVAHALQLEADGADLLDLGAESTRPGSEPVAAEQQLERLLPVLERLQGRLQIPLSVDTTSADVADGCLRAGASIINDISGFHAEPELPRVCAAHGAGAVLMHIKGTPRTMQQDTVYADLLFEIRGYLREGLQSGRAAGLRDEMMVVDPGLGFGKSFEQNYRLIGHLSYFHGLGAGVLAGPSRKGFTGEFCQLPAGERQFPTAAAVSLAVLHGADIVRVHDVREMKQVVDILDRFRNITRSDDA